MGSSRLLLLVLLLVCGVAYAQLQMCSQQDVAISETIVDSMSPYDFQIVELGADKSAVLAKVTSGSMYRSTDSGHTFVKWNSHIDPANQETDKRVATITRMADNNKVIIFGGSQSRSSTPVWSSSDAGATIGPVTTPSGFSFFYCRPHPTRGTWVACLGMSLPCTTDLCHSDIFVSTDFGATWRSFVRYVRAFEWAYLPDHPSWTGEDIILYTQTNSQSGNQQAATNADYSLYSGSITQGSPKRLLTQVPHVYADQGLFYAVSFSNPTASSSLYGTPFVSNDAGKTWLEATMPPGTGQSGWSVLDAEDAVFLSSLNPDNTADVYVSDEFDADYSLSLARVKRAGTLHDFAGFANLRGIYVANTMDRLGNTETKITFDNGGRWRRLHVDGSSCTSPTPDVDCALNLNGPSDNVFGRFYSEYDAIGVMLATGNVGRYLDVYGGDTDTYLTRNGGVSWHKIRDGPSFYEFGDHGSLILLADAEADTNTLLYSWTSGQTFIQCRFAQDPLTVMNIVVSEAGAQEFYLHGTRTVNGTRVGSIVHVDFTNFHQRECDAADYEVWSPDDGTRTNCTLGQHISYTRRKADADCFNSAAFEPEVVGSTCPCQESDYECGYCFRLDESTQPPSCRYTCPVGSATDPPPVCQGVYYPQSNGWRLVEGTKCDLTAPGAVNKLGTPVPCPGLKATSTVMGIIGGIIILLLLAMAGFVAYTNSDRLRRWVNEKLNPTDDVFTLPESVLGEGRVAPPAGEEELGEPRMGGALPTSAPVSRTGKPAQEDDGEDL